MRKEIKTLSDVQEIITLRVDVFDTQGYRIHFVRLLNMTLIDILSILGTGWHYDID